MGGLLKKCVNETGTDGTADGPINSKKKLKIEHHKVKNYKKKKKGASYPRGRSGLLLEPLYLCLHWRCALMEKGGGQYCEYQLQIKVH